MKYMSKGQSMTETSQTTPTTKPRHHGNLREVLIDAGLAILSNEGLGALTLRKAAARAGVSHAAPAHHFDGKTGLLAAIATRGFATFTAYMKQDRYTHGTTPNGQLRGISDGYLRFASDQEALFRLIFNTDFKSQCDDPALKQACNAAYNELADVCALFEPSPMGAGVNEMAIWSLVHGYAGLCTFNKSSDPDTGDTIPFEALLPPLQPRET
jgi:AcrR family transcriptional regulator